MSEDIEDLMDLRVRRRITCTKGLCMYGVCGNALDSIEHKFLKIRYLLTLSKETCLEDDFLSLRQQAFEGRGGNPSRRATDFHRYDARCNAFGLIEVASLIANRDGLMNQFNKARRIEVDVCKSG